MSASFPVVTLSPSPLQFTSEIFRDHASYLTTLLSDPALKKRGQQLLDQYNRYLNQKGWRNDSGQALSLLDQSKSFTNAVLQGKIQRKAIGCIFQSLPQHMIDEMNFFGPIMQNQPVQLEDLLHFSAEHNQSALLLASHLLDPIETAAIAATTQSAAQFAQLEQNIGQMSTPEDLAQMIILAEQMNQQFGVDGGQLVQKTLGGQVSSLPSAPFFAQLLQHEGKENDYLTQMIRLASAQ